MTTGSSITLALYAQIATTLASEPLKITRTSTKALHVSKANLSQVRKSREIFGSRGIANLGQTCYIAAIIHLFRHSVSAILRSSDTDAFSNQRTPDSTHVMKEEASALLLAKALRSAIIQIGNTKVDEPFYPGNLKRCLLAVKHDWRSDDQQDAHEAWTALRGAVHACTN